MNKRRALVLLWVLVVIGFLSHNLYLFLGKHFQPDTDILSLLPARDRDPLLQKAFSHMVESTEQQVIVLIGAPDWRQAVAAADTYASSIARHSDLLAPKIASIDTAQGEWIDFFYRHRLNLLTEKQQQELKTQDSAFWLNASLSSLYTPFGGLKIGAWQDDPFGLFAGWVEERARETPVRTRDGWLYVANGETRYIFLPLTLKLPAFSTGAQKDSLAALAEAKNAVQETHANAEILTGGVILHAAAASRQADREISTIGLGAMAGVVLLIFLTFRSFRPVLLISLSITIGLAGALSVCYLVYGQVHVLTLVFGASLIGIAQDYGIYFLCNRASADKNMDSWQLSRYLLPSMALTLVTTVIGYVGMMLTPFPGMHQMALFAMCGLLFAWLTVMCWFPFLLSRTTFSNQPRLDWYKRLIDIWPQAGYNRHTLVFSVLFACFCLAGLYQLSTNDDVRLLMTPDQHLLQEQKKISTLLGMAAPTQFYLIRGETPDAVLQKEEMLRKKLDPLVGKGTLSGYLALSPWIPSRQTQKANQELVQEKLLSSGPLKALQQHIGANKGWDAMVRHHLMAAGTPLDIRQFLEMTGAESLKHLWLETEDGQYASIMTLKGVGVDNLEILAGIAAEMEGIQWVDKVGEISSVLGYYRQYMGWVVLLSFGTIFVLLFFRYRKDTWRIMLPIVLASAGTLAFLGMTGKNLQLFNMLALMLVLGMGADYGIYLQENVQKNLQSVWLEIGLSAISTLLAFGLLSLSNTPALNAFGLTLLVGLSLVWMLVPCFRKRKPEHE